MRAIIIKDCMGHVLVPAFCPLAGPGVKGPCQHHSQRNDPLPCSYDEAAGIEPPPSCPLRRLPEAMIIDSVEA